MAVYRLDDDLFAFPSVEEAVAENDYLLAVGGDYIKSSYEVRPTLMHEEPIFWYNSTPFKLRG